MGRLFALTKNWVRRLCGNGDVVPVGMPNPARCELTIEFSDLSGFVSSSGQTNSTVVPITQDYLGLMLPIIRRHRGYIDHFLGDGIMFFFGAPLPNPNHAVDAVSAALEMRAASTA
jgi:class 3 adenylate cyclase